MIPTLKIVATGDVAQGRQLIPLARQQLQILKREMSFQNLAEGVRTVKPFDGVIIECWKSYRHEEVHIHVVEHGKAGGGEEIILEEKKECLCLPHFALGVVQAVHPEAPVEGDFESQEDYEAAVDTFNDFLVAGRFTYDISICNEDRYIGFEGALSIGWERYHIGEYVLVTIGDEMPSWPYPLDCERGCLVDNPRFVDIAISPMFIIGEMKRWRGYERRKKVIRG